MFKDYDKYLSASLKVYIFVLLFVFILKLVGMDYFALAIDNPIMIKIANIIRSNMLINNLILFFPLVLNQFVIITLVCKYYLKTITIVI